MAAQDEKALYTDLENWYSSLNTIIKNYGGGVIEELAIPVTTTLQASDINNFNNKMTEMKNDTYLSNATYPTYSNVSKGTQIAYTQSVPLANATTITYLGQIKCRNTVTNSNGNNSHGRNTHGTHSNGENTFGVYNGRNNGNGGHDNGNRSNGTCTNTKRAHGTYIDLTCIKTST